MLVHDPRARALPMTDSPTRPLPPLAERFLARRTGRRPTIADSRGAIARLLLAAVSSLGLAGCAAPPPPAYQTETFSLASNYSRQFGESVERTCDAARRALLSQGYVVTEFRPGSINGRKMFQPEAESHVQIDFTVSCIGGRRSVTGSTAFVSAVQERYALKKTPTSASVGSPVGTISLPFGSTSDAMVRIASETVASSAFYNRFFALMEHYLAYLDDEDPPEPPASSELPANRQLEPGG